MNWDSGVNWDSGRWDDGVVAKQMALPFVILAALIAAMLAGMLLL